MKPLNHLFNTPAKQLEVLTWVLPTLCTPGGRFLFSDHKDERSRLFVRDASTMSIGAAIYLGTRAWMNRLLPGRPWISFGAAMAANQLFTVFGAVKLSHWVQARQEIGSGQPFRSFQPTASSGRERSPTFAPTGVFTSFLRAGTTIPTTALPPVLWRGASV